VEVEVLLQPRAIDRPRLLDVDPAKRRPIGRRPALDDLDVGPLRLGWASDDRAA
jgi:hypothetical protein